MHRPTLVKLEAEEKLPQLTYEPRCSLFYVIEVLKLFSYFLMQFD